MQARRKELESYFVEFPDVPREAIIKNDMLRLGLKFSKSALDRTGGCRVKSYRLFTYDKVGYDQLGDEPFKAPEDLDIEGGPYGLRKTRFQVRFNVDSPYVVDVVDGEIGIYEEGIFIAKASYPPAPDWYDDTFEDGTRYCDIVCFAGPLAFCTANRVCQFWGDKEECKFCDINKNVGQGAKYGKFSLGKARKPLKQVVEVAKKAVKWEEKDEEGIRMRPSGIIITGGVILKEVDGKSEEDFFSNMLRR